MRTLGRALLGLLCLPLLAVFRLGDTWDRTRAHLRDARVEWRQRKRLR